MNHKLNQIRVGDTLVSKKTQVSEGEVRVLPGDKALCIDTNYNGKHMFLFKSGDVLFCRRGNISKHFKSSPIGFMAKFANYKFKQNGITAKKFHAGFFDEVWSRTGASYLKLKHKV